MHAARLVYKLNEEVLRALPHYLMSAGYRASSPMIHASQSKRCNVSGRFKQEVVNT